MKKILFTVLIILFPILSFAGDVEIYQTEPEAIKFNINSDQISVNYSGEGPEEYIVEPAQIYFRCKQGSYVNYIHTGNEIAIQCKGAK